MSDLYHNENNILKEKYQKATEAFRNNEKRTSAILIHEILDQDINHLGAWHLMYYIVGSTKPFEEFQMEFAQKYYPHQFQQLIKNATPPAQPVPNPALPNKPLSQPSVQPAPARQTPTPVINSVPPNRPATHQTFVASAPNHPVYCPKCGQQRIGKAQFCTACGFRFEPVAVHQPTSSQAIAARTHSPARTSSEPRFLSIPQSQWMWVGIAAVIYVIGMVIADRLANQFGLFITYTADNNYILWFPLLQLPFLILACNQFKFNRDFFLGILGGIIIPLSTMIWQASLGEGSFLLQIVSSVAPWILIAWLFNFPTINIKRALIWCLTSLALTFLDDLAFYYFQSAFGFTYSQFSIIGYVIQFVWGMLIAIGYVLFPTGKQKKHPQPARPTPLVENNVLKTILVILGGMAGLFLALFVLSKIL